MGVTLSLFLAIKLKSKYDYRVPCNKLELITCVCVYRGIVYNQLFIHLTTRNQPRVATQHMKIAYLRLNNFLNIEHYYAYFERVLLKVSNAVEGLSDEIIRSGGYYKYTRDYTL